MKFVVLYYQIRISVPMKTIKTLIPEYAVFRPDIHEYFQMKILKEPLVILDPMAGTAPLIPFIETHGHRAYLNDILPVHFYINRAKRYQIFQCYKQYGYDWYVQQLLHCMAPLQGKHLCISDKWIDDSVLDSLIQAWHAVERYDESAAILLKATILLCVRPFSSITRTENPTWFKAGGMSSNKDLQEIVGESLTRFDKYYSHCYESSHIDRRGESIIMCQNASELRLPQKVDLILTSPPYCNRLDPIVQYGPESYFLSAVGHTSPEKGLIGTTKVRDYETFATDFEYLTSKSEYASHLLNKIRKSPKADDPAYYLKYYTRYFAMIHQTLDRVLDNLSSSGKMYIVLQDNTHRGELIEIDRVLRELLGANGWRCRVVKKWERHHLGLRHISREHAFVRPKQSEKLVVMLR